MIRRIFLSGMPGLLVLLVAGMYFQAAAQSAGNRESWQSQFAVPAPSEANLRAFEDRAAQKLRDLADYIKLISTSGLDEKLRDQAVKQALALFYASSCVVLDPLLNANSTNAQGAAAYLGSLNEAGYHHVELQQADVHIQDPLAPAGDGTYRGSLACSGAYTYFKTGKKKAFVKETAYQVEVVLKKVQKSFGDSASEVWVVYLGDFQQ